MKKTLLLLGGILSLYAQKGVIISPVADLVGYSLAKNRISYNKLPVASTALHACPRLHQALYNETVNIIKETNNEYYISIPHLFFITQVSNKPHCTYWIEKKHVLPIESLNRDDLKFIPEPIRYDNKHQNSQQKIVTLIKPLFCKQLNETFSVGTRFVIHQEKLSSYTVYTYNPKQKRFFNLDIPKSCALMTNKLHKKEALKTYVKLLKNWTYIPGYTPYVWGGCSLTTQNNTDAFNIESKAYVIKNDTKTYKHGFDCAGLIARAAQAAGIPYYYKNTTTLAHYLKPIKHKENIREGDLIWIPGHVMAIGSLKDNTVIETRHYSHGYGKLHEIPLHEIFKEIKTFDQLFDTIQNKQPLLRLNKTGKVVQKIYHAKMLSMASCFDTNKSV